MNNAKTGLFAGSFDPLTNGHLDLVDKALKVFTHLVVVVADNPDKTYLFDGPTRLTICQEAMADKPGVTVIRGEGLTAQLAVKLGVSALVRGVRSATDFTWESQLAQINHFIAPQLETVFFPADPQMTHLSSAQVKNLWAQGVDIASLVPPATLKAFDNLSNQKSLGQTPDLPTKTVIKQRAGD